MQQFSGKFYYDLNYSKRNSIVDTFKYTYSINLEGYDGGFISSPSLTSDKQELYLYSDDYNTLKFTRYDSLTYTLDGKLNILNLPTGPGQLSKDGSKYFCSLYKNDGSEKLYKMQRQNISMPFSDTTILNKYINDNSLTNQQPSISLDEEVFVWVRNNGGTWGGNDIYITKNRISSISNIDSNNDSKIYPNPVNETIFFDNTEHKFVKIEIYNTLGECVINKELINGENYIEVRSLSKGTYLMKLTNKNREIKNKFIKD